MTKLAAALYTAGTIAGLAAGALVSIPASAAQLTVDAGAKNDPSRGMFRTLQAALKVAQPGDVVRVQPGTYTEYVTTVRSGTPDRPIVIQGSPGAQLVSPKKYDGRLLSVYHDNITISGLTFRQAAILLYVFGGSNNTIRGNTFVDAGGECVRIKYLARNNLVEGNNISDCGRRGFNPSKKKKNGEGVYIGTAPEQLSRNPKVEVPANAPHGKPNKNPDRTAANIIRGNRIHTPAECVDIKEAAVENRIIANKCSGNRDPDNGAFSARGDRNRFENNRLVGPVAGAGIRLGGDEEDQGVDNIVIGNDLRNTEGYAVKDIRTPQGAICNNMIGNNEAGLSRSGLDPAKGCS